MFRLLCTCLFMFLSVASIGQQSEKVTLLCNWLDTTNIRPNNGSYFNDVWGFVNKGKEYAAIGSTEGVHIIDVDNCEEVAFYRGSSSGPHVVHRDYKVFKNYLYAVCDQSADSRLQIFDISYLPDSLPLVYESTKNECVRSHNIFIDTAKAKLYFASHYFVDTNGGPADYSMTCFSLEDPKHPVFLTGIPFFGLFQPVHDVYVRNDTAYCSVANAGYMVIDFSRDTAYDIIGVLPDYDYKGYNHASWINSKGIGVMADETHGMPIKVIDTRDINNIEVLSTFMPNPGDTNCIPHNPFFFDDNHVLISYYMDGLQIYNVSKPDSPYRTGYYDTYPGTSYKVMQGAWGCYPYLPSHRILVSDRQTGLYVFNADSALDIHTRPTPMPGRLNIYPNPVTDKLIISLPETGDIALSVCDIQGRVILKQSISLGSVPNQGIELPLPRNCPMGMYIIHIIAGSNTYTGKFIKAQN